MFQYFLTPEDMLPPGIGFSHFDKIHIAALSVAAACILLGITLYRRLGQRGRRCMGRSLALTMVVSEAVKDLLLVVNGSFSVGYLPLHLCSISMVFCLGYTFGKRKTGWGQLLYALALPGGTAALLFPDWVKFPVLHFCFLHSFIYHTILVMIPLMTLLAGEYRPRLRRLPAVLGILGAIGGIIYLFDLKTGTNYLFLLRPVPNSPLSLAAESPWGYLPAYGALVCTVEGLLFAVGSIVCKKVNSDLHD